MNQVAYRYAVEVAGAIAGAIAGVGDGAAAVVIGVALMSGPAAAAPLAPLALLDRNGSYVSIETYAPNIVRITLAVDKDLALGAPGYGFIGAADATGWKHQAGASGDIFSSAAMALQVAARPWPNAPSQMERYF